MGKIAPSMFIVAVVVLLVTAGNVSAGECDQPRTSEVIARCLGDELRVSDAKINESYQSLMGKLSEVERTKLRNEQRAWLKERDAVCGLNSRESNREKWFQAILTDYRKTVCVTRYTRIRTAELDQMVAKLAAPATPTQTPHDAKKKEERIVTRRDESEYRIASPRSHERGRWYFEIAIKPSEIAKLSPTALWMGCSESQTRTAVGTLAHIRPSDANATTLHFGFALDLDEGRFYSSVTGVWRNGEPGSAKGIPAKAGRSYRCAVDSTAPVAPMVERSLIDVNFGERPFAYAIPSGYRSFVERVSDFSFEQKRRFELSKNASPERQYTDPMLQKAVLARR